MSARLSIYRDRETGGLQLTIGDGVGGYRILGPKMTGRSELLAEKILSERDIEEIANFTDLEVK